MRANFIISLYLYMAFFMGKPVQEDWSFFAQLCERRVARDWLERMGRASQAPA
jgi:hypothetical protein